MNTAITLNEPTERRTLRPRRESDRSVALERDVLLELDCINQRADTLNDQLQTIIVKAEGVGARGALIEAQLLLCSLGYTEAADALVRHRGSVLNRSLVAMEAREVVAKARQA
jgi:hypothetical protein